MPLSPDTPVTCVMPAYNEEVLLVEAVEGIVAFWARQPNPFTMVVVDDGSTDGTADLLTAIDRRHDNLVGVGYQPNRGKGAAVRAGVAAAPEGGVLYFVDSDLPYSLDDQRRVVAALGEGTPVAYGSRVVEKGFQGSSLLRRLASRVLIVLNRLLLGIKVTDNQCGLKAFETRIAKKVFDLNPIDGFGFDLFTTAYLTAHEVGIATVPVELLPERRPSTVNVVKTSLKMLREIFVVRRTVRRLPRDPSLLEA
jgi:dolichyl-phosphate beta-glucosyltransferase